jgi:hypothetical protein
MQGIDMYVYMYVHEMQIRQQGMTINELPLKVSVTA